jgi:hypothetical protein
VDGNHWLVTIAEKNQKVLKRRQERSWHLLVSNGNHVSVTISEKRTFLTLHAGRRTKGGQ